LTDREKLSVSQDFRSMELVIPSCGFHLWAAEHCRRSWGARSSSV